MTEQHINGMQGLTSSQAKELQEKYGKNELASEKKESFFHKILHVISEPMFLLLIVAAIIYFILGEPRDGSIMLVFVIGIIGIEVIQEWKTDKTLNALKDLNYVDLATEVISTKNSGLTKSARMQYRAGGFCGKNSA